MATTTTPRAAAGGSFLIESPRPEDVFTPAELTDDQRLIGQTAEEFVAKEVTPLIPDLELHKQGLMSSLLKKVGELGLLAAAFQRMQVGRTKSPARCLRKSPDVCVVQRQPGPTPASAPRPRLFRDRGTEEVSAQARDGETIGCYCLSNRRPVPMHRTPRPPCSSGRQALDIERAEDVDQQRRLC
jgi:hypothetical protein